MPSKKRSNKKKKQQATATRAISDGPSLPPTPSTSTSLVQNKVQEEHRVPDGAVQAAISAVLAASKVGQPMEKELLPMADAEPTAEHSPPSRAGQPLIREETVATVGRPTSPATTADDMDDVGPPPPPKPATFTQAGVKALSKQDEIATQQGIMDAIQSPLAQPAPVHLNQHPKRSSVHRRNHPSPPHPAEDRRSRPKQDEPDPKAAGTAQQRLCFIL